MKIDSIQDIVGRGFVVCGHKEDGEEFHVGDVCCLTIDDKRDSELPKLVTTVKGVERLNSLVGIVLGKPEGMELKDLTDYGFNYIKR